jgi:hypothetical protein
VTVAFVLTVLVLAGPVPAAEPGSELRLVDQGGGAIGGVALAGDGVKRRALVGLGPRLAVLDLGQPLTPTLVGRSPILPAIVTDVAIDEAAAADRLPALAWVTLAGPWTGSDLDYPRTISAPGPHAQGHLIDLRDPAAPRIAGRVTAPAPILDAELAGDLLLLAAGDGGVVAVDVADPDEPHVLAEVKGLGQAVAVTTLVTAEGRIAWVLDRRGRRLRALDLGDPTAPRVLGDVRVGAWASGLARRGTLLVVTDADGLLVIDVSAPERPVVQARRFTGSYGFSGLGPAFGGDHLYVIQSGIRCGWPSLHRIALRGLLEDDLEELGSIPGTGRVVAGPDLALVAMGVDGLSLWSAQRPEELLPRLDLVHSASAVAVAPGRRADWLAVTDVGGGSWWSTSGRGWGRGLRILARDNLAALSPTRIHGFPATAADVAILGDTVLVAEGQNCQWGNSDLHIHDYATSSEPRDLGWVSLAGQGTSSGFPGNSAAVAVSGTLAYVADDFGWLSIVDLIDPAVAFRVELVDFGSQQGVEALDVSIAGDTAWVALGGDGLRAVDVANPARPRVAGSAEVPREPDAPKDRFAVMRSVAATEDAIYVAAGSAGILAYRPARDAIPGDPSEPGTPPPPGDPRDPADTAPADRDPTLAGQRPELHALHLSLDGTRLLATGVATATGQAWLW